MKERMAIYAYRHKQQVELHKVLTLSAAAFGSDKFNDQFRELLGLALPEYAESREDKAKRAVEKIKKEQERGPLIAQPMELESRRTRGINATYRRRKL